MEFNGVKGRGIGFTLGRGGGIRGEPVTADVEDELVSVFVLILRRGAVSRPLRDVVGIELGSKAVGLDLEESKRDRGGEGEMTVPFAVEVGNGERLGRFIEACLILSAGGEEGGEGGGESSEDFR